MVMSGISKQKECKSGSNRDMYGGREDLANNVIFQQ